MASSRDEAQLLAPGRQCVFEHDVPELNATRPGERLPVLILTAPLPTEAELAKKRAMQPKIQDPEAGEVVAAAVLMPSKQPALIRAFARVAKIGALAGFLLIGMFYLTKNVVLPFVREMQNPGTQVDPSAPAAVQMLQQTRKVVAENNDRVEKLNLIIDVADATAKAPSGTSTVAAPTPAPAAPRAQPAPPVAEAPQRNDEIQRFLGQLKISGAVGGRSPRITLGDRIIKFGDVVHHGLGLRFVHVNEATREVHFIDAKATVYRRWY